MLALFYVYGIIGIQLYGGKIRAFDERLVPLSYGQACYWSNNFNDFPSALAVLFELMIVNNWQELMEAFETVGSSSILFM